MTRTAPAVPPQHGLQPAPAPPLFRGPAWWLVVALTLAAAVIPAVLWIGDISWMQDEPRLLAKAWHANQQGKVETHGLNGNFGVPYGPLPTQIYQLLLLVSHDPMTIGMIRAGACAGVTAIGLLWLARSLRLNPWFSLAVVLAPYVWNFHRILWDASFAVPIGTVALAAYAAFLRTSSGPALLLCAACTGALAFIHPQDLPLLLPIVAHVVWKRRPALARHYVGIAVVCGILFALNAGYFRKAYDALVWQATHGGLARGYPGTQSRLLSMTTPLLGGEILAGHRFATYDSRLAAHPALVNSAKFASMIVYPLIWLGVVVASVRLLRRRPLTERSHDDRPSADRVPRYGRADDDAGVNGSPDPTLADARRAVYGIALAGLLLQILLYGVMRMPVAPQYFFGTFPIHVLLAWVGVDFLRRFRVGWLAILIYGASVAYITLASAVHIHRVGYARNTYRPSLANQIEVARALNRYTDPAVMTNVVLFQSHPQSLRALRLLIPPEPVRSQLEGRTLVVRHKSGPGGEDSAVELVEAPAGASLDERFQPLDVTPLPPEWHPASW